MKNTIHLNKKLEDKRIQNKYRLLKFHENLWTYF